MKMNRFKTLLTAALLFPMVVASLPAMAAAAEEFHTSANMRYGGQFAIPETHGYVRVISDASGNGMIDVMFFNGNPEVQALFNASVRFIDASGRLVVETHFNCRVGEVSPDGAGECKVSKPLNKTLFDSVEVDFYLSDLPDPNLLALN